MKLGDFVVNNYDYEDKFENFAIMITASKPVDDDTPALQPDLYQRVVSINGTPYYRLDLCM